MATKKKRVPTGARRFEAAEQVGTGGASAEGAEQKKPPLVDIGTDEGRTKLLNLLCDQVADEFEFRKASYDEDWRRWLEQYKADALPEKTYPWPGASNLSVNLTAIYTDTLVARIMQSIFAATPFWVSRPFNKKLSEIAEPLERFLDWQRQYAWNEYHVVKPMVLELVKLGTGILHNAWVNLPIVKTDERTGDLVELGQRVGPRPSWVPLEDFVMPRGFTRINDAEDGIRAPWVSYRRRYNKQDLQRFTYTGFFDKVAVEKVYKARSDDVSPVTELRQRSGEATPSPGTTDESDIWDIWEIWLSWDLNDDGYPEDYVAYVHLASKSMLRLRPNPYLNGMRPFVSCPFIEQEGEFYGIGCPEMVESYEAEVTTMHNQRIDNGHIANTVMLAARRGSGITDKMRVYPGKIFLVGDPTQDIKELRFGGSYLNSIQEEQLTTALAERRIGISDLNLGRESSPLGRAAATTVMQLLQEGSRRHDLQTSDLRRALSEQALQIVELYQTHGVPGPEVPGSPEQILDAEEAAGVRLVLESQDHIAGLLGLTIGAATQSVNKEVERQAKLDLFALLTTQYYQPILNILPALMDPNAGFAREIVLQMIAGTDEFLKGILSTNNIYEWEKYLLSDDLRAMAAQAAAQPPQPPMLGGPGQPGAPGGGTPPQGGQPQLPPPSPNGAPPVQ